MIASLTGAVVGLLKSALTIVILAVLLVALVGWAKANPEQAQASLTKVIATGVAVLAWACDQIIAALS